VLQTVLTALFEAMSILLRGQVDKRQLLENYELLLLTLDELVDNGIVLETDPQVLVDRVSMKDAVAEQPAEGLEGISRLADRFKNQFLKS